MSERMVGVVAELRRYPVKSMGAENLQSATVSWHGLAGDRRWAFVRPGMERSGFPWLTIRQKPDLWRYEPRVLDVDDIQMSQTIVRTPEGAEFEVVDPELGQQLGEGVRVIKHNLGVFDTFPISILTVQSVESLSNLVGEQLMPLRFRPNIVIHATAAGPFPEDQWVGAVLRVGKLRCRVDVRDHRCVVVNVDPAGGIANPAVLKAIANQRNARFGVYGTTMEPGEVAVSDPVFLEQ